MKPVQLAILALLAGFTVAAESEESSDAGTRFRAKMVGTQEVPAIFTDGEAVFTAHVINNDSAIEFEVTYTGLSGPPAASHVHFGQRSVNGGVSFFLCGGGGQAPCPAATSASFSGIVTADKVVGPAVQGIAPGDLAAILKMMRKGVSYANIHTAKHPGGEIRGQLKVVGESE